MQGNFDEAWRDHRPLPFAEKMPRSSPQPAALGGQPPFSRRQERESRMFRADGEPPLSELLADPVLQLLIKRDGISLDELRKLINDLRERRPPDKPPEKG